MRRRKLLAAGRRVIPREVRLPRLPFSAALGSGIVRCRAQYRKVVLLGCAALLVASAWASDPQPYEVKLDSGGGGALEQTIQTISLLISLRTSAPVSSFGLIERARGDMGRIEAALNSFGYYSPHVEITIADRPATDAELPAVLDRIPQGRNTNVSITIDRGALYKIRSVSIDGALPASARGALGISPGDPAVAAEAVAAQARLLTALQEEGYAFATVETPVAYPEDKDHVVDLTFKVNAGERVNIGQLVLDGLKDVNEAFVRQALTVHSGELYQPSKIEAARQKLAALGVFSGVSVRPADKSTMGAVDLIFDFQERPKHAISLSGNFSTDLGFTGSVNWSDRNLLGNAEQLNLSGSITDVGGSATKGVGYNLNAQFIRPWFLKEDQSLEFDVAAIRQDLDAYNQTAETLGGFVRRKFSTEWSGSLGLTATYDDVLQESVRRLYQLIALPMTIAYDSTGLGNPLNDPVKGIRALVTLTPTYAFGAAQFPFVILQASGATYYKLSDDARSVLALRALVGSIQGAANLEVPPDQRLYLGGSGSVRGFRFQSIGPVFADGKPQGAASIDAATVEFRQRILEDWGAAAFVDAGQASAQSVPFSSELNVGAGVGVRYYTSIGAVRADVAVPLTKVPHNDSFEVYIGIGQAF